MYDLRTKKEWSLDLSLVSALVISQLVLIRLVIWRVIPTSSGWYMTWVDVARSRVPYRDFYVPFPPGALFFEGFLPNLFAKQFVYQDVLHSIYWISMAVALYSLIRYFAAPVESFVACAIALSVYFVQPGNIISGYYETMYMFLIAGLSLSLYSCRKKYKFLFLLAGMTLSISTTIKQTAWLPAGFLLVALCFELGPFRGLALKMRLHFLCGAIAPWLLVTVWNLQVGNFGEMWRALLSGGGKGSSDLTVIPLFLQSVIQGRELWIVFLALSTYLLLRNRQEELSRKASWVVGTILMVWIVSDVMFAGSAPNVGQAIQLVFAILLFAIGASRTWSDRTGTNSIKIPRIAVLSALLGLLVVILMANVRQPVSGLLSINVPLWLFQGGQRLTYSLYALALCGLGYCVIHSLGRGDSLESRSRDFRLVIVVMLSLQVLNSFAGTPTLETWLLVLPFGILMLRDLLAQLVDEKATAVIGGLLVLWLPALSAIQNAQPYDWLGIKSPPVVELRVRPKVSGLEEFRVSATKALFLEQLERFAKPSVMRGTPTLVGVRNSGMASLIGLNVYPLNCVVLWWDVCPENLAQADFARIQRNPPKTVLWTFEDEPTINGNELAWRSGQKSAVRNIQDFLTKQMSEDRYRTLFEMPENDDGSGPITRLLVRTS